MAILLDVPEPTLMYDDGTTLNYPITKENDQVTYGPPARWTLPPPSEQSTILIEKLPKLMDGKDLLKIFSAAGKIFQLQSLNCPDSQMSKMIFSCKEEAELAVEKFNNFQLPDGHQIKVSISASPFENHKTLASMDMVFSHLDGPVKLVDKQPAFLQGYAGLIPKSAPVQVIRCPNGRLARAGKDPIAYEDLKREVECALRDIRRINKKWTFGSAKVNESLIRVRAKLGMPSTQTLSLSQQRELLPVFQFRDKFLQEVAANQVIIVVAETGSGKTTQLAQYLSEAGYGSGSRKIGCTQPRRVAASSVARRVSEEVGCQLGNQVGYKIRFEDCTSASTVIKYMTDGIVINECLFDPELNGYSVIILDEAHERSLYTDVLFGLIKAVLKKRKDLKLIVTSATLDNQSFSSYFFNAPVLTIPGKTHPVEIIYKQPFSHYMTVALSTVLEIHLTQGPGDILLFLPGEKEIEHSCQVLEEIVSTLGYEVPDLLILPVYGALPAEMQTKIFDPAPAGARKVVIATNIAETSLTVDGITYVVDPGFVKQNVYNSRTKIEQLDVTPISQAQATQRAGRAGRTGPGKCYRLYSEDAFQKEMLPNSIPEIQRTNLFQTVLHLKAIGVKDPVNFEFMDPPPVEVIVSALVQLHSLGALDDEGELTRTGRRMAQFPLDPMLSKMIITSVDLDCSDEVVTVASMLSARNIFYNPPKHRQKANERRNSFLDAQGDHITFINVYNAWLSKTYKKDWCRENFINHQALEYAHKVRKQLLEIMSKFKMDVVSSRGDMERVRKAICAGSLLNVARMPLFGRHAYTTLGDNETVFIHPSSVLFHRSPAWLVFKEVVQTTKNYMKEVITIDPNWLVELAPARFQHA